MRNTLSSKEKTTTKNLIKKFSKEKENTFLAISNNTLLGFAKLNQFNDRRNHVGDFVIFVTKREYGKGTSKKLLKKLFKRVRELKLKRLELGVFLDNKRAIQFYKKFGFVEEGIKCKSIQRENKLYNELIMAKIFKI